jgi:exopolysaccharide biosynthesis predicted pyruvyltransferase EpsI
VGDSAIWVGELKALKIYFRSPPKNTREKLSGSEKLPSLPKNIQIIIHGGGNLGDLWESYQLFRERIVREYPNNKIVQMPQSIYFKNQASLERCRQVFSAHPDLTIMTRDHASYEIAKTIHGGQTELVPDMALAIGTIPRPCKPKVPIFALLRTDQEKLVSDDLQILGKLKAEDWIQEPFYRETQLLYHAKRVERKLPIVSIGKIVIDAVIPYLEEDNYNKVLESIYFQLYLFTYPFWIIEYRRIQSWKYAVGLCLGFRPRNTFPETKVALVSFIKLYVTYYTICLIGLSTPVKLFDSLRTYLYSLSKTLFLQRKTSLNNLAKNDSI